MSYLHDFERRYDLDWLRIIGIGTVFIFHSLIIFINNNWYISNNETSILLYYLVSFIILWMMPLFFIISGKVMLYSLEKKDVKTLLKDRFKRLAIPLFIGIFVLSSVVIYIKRISEGVYSGGFFNFYINEYFQGFYLFGGNFAWMGLHLWYLLYLFLFILITIFPVRYLLKKKEILFFNNIISFLSKPGAIFLLSIPIILTNFISKFEPTILGRVGTGGWGILTYFVFFAYGILTASDRRYDKIIDNNLKISIVFNCILFIVYFWLIVNYQIYLKTNPLIESIIVGLFSFSILITLFGLFHLRIKKGSVALKEMTEGVLPFYVLHFLIIVIVGFFIIRIYCNLYVKVILIILISFSLTISIYHFIIKRINVLRFLFGMKLKKS